VHAVRVKRASETPSPTMLLQLLEDLLKQM
jgi:hypothetical protein